jgi:predicted O-methyltransferase YrrM
MTIRVAKDETFVEVGFSQAGKLLVSCGAAARGVKTAIEKEVDVVGTAAMDEWRGILTTTDEMNRDQQRRAGLLVERLNFGMEHYLSKRLEKLADWLVNSRELTNFTYKISDIGMTYFAQSVAMATGASIEQARGWLGEPEENEELLNHLTMKHQASEMKCVADDIPRFARRLVWYALVRARKPKLVVETGVDKGLGAVLLCSAVKKNVEEGHQGYYVGTDINPEAGYLLDGVYSQFGRVISGDSIETLKQLPQAVEVFINDSDHSADYEEREYQVIESKLAQDALVLGDNAHVTQKLAEFAEKTDRKFIFVPEMVEGHWYPGAGVGIAFGK